jgi:hypothetical protein
MVQPVSRLVSQRILNLVREILECACGTYYTQNRNWGTRSRSGDLHRFGWFNLCLDRFSQGILNLVREILDCACGTYYTQNRNCVTRSRSGDLHRFGWFNLCLDRFSQGILNLVTEFSYLVCNIQYWCFCVLNPKNGFVKM